MAFEVTSFFFEEEYFESISERFIKIGIITKKEGLIESVLKKEYKRYFKGGLLAFSWVLMLNPAEGETV
jgi:hypothetical protein